MKTRLDAVLGLHEQYGDSFYRQEKTTMGIQVQFDLPETVFSALRQTPTEFVQEMRLTAAVKWYDMRLISQAKAAEVAGISRQAFLDELRRFEVSPFQLSAEELLREVERG